MKFFVFLVILFFCFFVGAEEIDNEILKKFDAGEERVPILIEMKNEEFSVNRGGEKLVKMNVSRSEFENILNDPETIGIEPVRYFEAYLDDSVGLIDANSSWNLEVSNINLTGSGETVCVIDTGINYSHPDLLGKNLTACNLDCIDKICVENCSELDLNGHGTHVSGIIGASGGIDGIAKDVNLIGLKVFPGNSRSGATTTGISSAIDWCVANSETYNISVISMSLGTDTLYTSECDSSFSISFVPSVDAAYAKNISVTAASGNSGNTTGIGSPACLSKVIAVGGADKDGGMYSNGNRNSLVSLLGIGTNINSTRNTGGYESLSGTSMATPMVSGAIAIINQFLKLTSDTLTPLEIESELNGTGFDIYDSGSSRNYSRINIQDTLLNLDTISPDVALISPVDNHVNLSVNHSFVCNLTDWQLGNVTFEIWNSSGLYYNESVDVSGEGNSSSFNLTDMSSGEYSWNCLGTDLKSNSDYATSNFSLTVGGIEVSLNSPANDSYTNVNLTEFNCSAASDLNHSLSNMTFSLWNSSGDLINSSVVNISGSSNESIFNYTFAEDGTYEWACVALNNRSDEGNGVNYSLTYDSVSPVVSNNASSVTTSSATITWTTNESANSSLIVSGGVWGNSSSYVTSHSITVSSLAASTAYNYTLISCDRAGNCVNGTGSFTTSAVVVSSGGGGGGGGGGVTTLASTVSEDGVYDVESAEVSGGHTQELKEGEKLNFSLFDFNGGRHLLTVNIVESDYVVLTIQSDPIYLKLGEGQSVKLNLSSANYYDLFVKVEKILNESVELTIQLINEPIVLVREEVVEIEKEVEIEGEDNFWVVVVLVLILAAVGFVVSRRKHPKKLKKRKAKKKRGKGKKVKAKTKRAR
ncbi:S8 family serine peptidase [Methanococcoides sp. SA1]|nr:S8 family serine peptidase [Methanococcoides sp. SA1]